MDQQTDAQKRIAGYAAELDRLLHDYDRHRVGFEDVLDEVGGIADGLREAGNEHMEPLDLMDATLAMLRLMYTGTCESRVESAGQGRFRRPDEGLAAVGCLLDNAKEAREFVRQRQVAAARKEAEA